MGNNVEYFGVYLFFWFSSSWVSSFSWVERHCPPAFKKRRKSWHSGLILPVLMLQPRLTQAAPTLWFYASYFQCSFALPMPAPPPGPRRSELWCHWSVWCRPAGWTWPSWSLSSCCSSAVWSRWDEPSWTLRNVSCTDTDSVTQWRCLCVCVFTAEFHKT